MEHRNDEQLAQLKKLVAEARADTARFCRYIKVARLAVRTTSDSSAFARLLALSSPGTPRRRSDPLGSSSTPSVGFG
jgi:hypothetical protein